MRKDFPQFVYTHFKYFLFQYYDIDIHIYFFSKLNSIFYWFWRMRRQTKLWTIFEDSTPPAKETLKTPAGITMRFHNKVIKVSLTNHHKWANFILQLLFFFFFWHNDTFATSFLTPIHFFFYFFIFLLFHLHTYEGKFNLYFLFTPSCLFSQLNYSTIFFLSKHCESKQFFIFHPTIDTFYFFTILTLIFPVF